MHRNSTPMRTIRLRARRGDVHRTNVELVSATVTLCRRTVWNCPE